MVSCLMFVTVVAAFLASIFLTPVRFVWISAGLVIIAVAVVIVIKKLWVSSEPNEWLLVIQGGKLKEAGIGLKTIVWPHQTCVKFPSSIQRVEFSANNVTKEMQGIEVAGFAIYSVSRDDDGPFKSYKYTQDGNANKNVQTMCESIIRHHIANNQLHDVLTNRNMIRDGMKNDLQKQLTGWGIWLETVEITSVRICSNSLFEDMQAEFRQDAHLKAENIRLNTNNVIEKSQMESGLQMNMTRQDTETKRVAHENTQKLKRQQEETTYHKKNCEFEATRIVQAQQLDIKKIQFDTDVKRKKLNDQLEIDKVQNDFTFKKFEDQLKVEGKMTPLTVQKYMIDSTKQIYSSLPLKEIKLNQYIGPESTGNIASMLPAIGMMMHQNQEVMAAQK